jgi:hypothetical protein
MKRKIEKALSNGKGSRACFSRKGKGGVFFLEEEVRRKRKEHVYFLEENKRAWRNMKECDCKWRRS